jgi:serine/threonine-protein kinase
MQVQLAAYSLLKDRQESKVKLQLESFDDLRSDVGVDYRKLRELLAAEKWSEAERETLAVMLKAAQTQEDWLYRPDIKTFPCNDLRIIDTLWVKYSKGIFGFSVQKRIWQELGSKVDYETNNLSAGICPQ